VVVYAYNLSYFGGRDRKAAVQGQPKQETQSEKQTKAKRAGGIT
jgi:hypothetical protein